MGTLTDDGTVAPQNLNEPVGNDTAVRAPDLATMYRRSITMPPPVYGRFSMPVDWQPSSVVTEEWGTLQVIIGGGDRTYYRGIPCQVTAIETTEPYDDAAASIYFPQVSWYERLRPEIDMHWATYGQEVVINRVLPNGGGIRQLFVGLLVSRRHSGQGQGIYMEAAGLLYQADYTIYPPEIIAAERDVGTAVADILDATPSRNFGPSNRPVTGLLTTKRGGWGTRLNDGVTDILTDAWSAEGQQWTVMLDGGRSPVIRLKDTTTPHWHVSVGQPGVIIDLNDDSANNPKVVWGEGTDPEGNVWRNTKYPPTQPPLYRPLRAWTKIEPDLWATDGTRLGPNPNYSPDLLRTERYVNYGEGIYKTVAERDAYWQVERAANYEPNYIGTITLDADPEEGSRWDIRAGQNIFVRYLPSPIPTWDQSSFYSDEGDGVLFHVSKCSQVPGGTVRLDVSYVGWDFYTQAALKARLREASDPARRPYEDRRTSKTSIDTKFVWDTESGAGVVPAFAVPGGGWAVVKVPMGETGNVDQARLTASPAARFALGVFSTPVTASQLAGILGNPLSGTVSSWRLQHERMKELGLQVAWGGPGQACGYYPVLESEGGTLTGLLIDEANWRYTTRTPPFFYVAAYAESGCSISGRFFQSAER